MGETSKGSTQPPPSRKIPKGTRPTYMSPTSGHLQTLNPRNNGSDLYDSYELRAVTYQLNKAMQRASCSSPAYLCYLKSPFYSQCLSRGNTKKVLCSHLTCATIDRNASNRTKGATRGFAAKLWDKVKQGLLRSNNMQRKELFIINSG
ncbi:hypothetical protein GQ457_17G017420 [Hibiscus cannabinus]